MTDIGKSDFVECIDVGPNPLCPVRLGVIYCVEAVVEVGVDCGACAERGKVCQQTGLRLKGVYHSLRGKKPDLVCSNAFKPIHKPCESTFVSDLQQIADDAALDAGVDELIRTLQGVGLRVERG